MAKTGINIRNNKVVSLSGVIFAVGSVKSRFYVHHYISISAYHIQQDGY
jgi:hypothetical protein